MKLEQLSYNAFKERHPEATHWELVLLQSAALTLLREKLAKAQAESIIQPNASQTVQEGKR